MNASASRLFDLSGRVAVVLGASRGIGRELALGLAGAGARVAVAGRTQSDIERCAGEIRAAGGDADAFRFDAMQLARLPAFVAGVVERLGGIDIFVHVAGLNRRKPAIELTEEDWNAVLDLNLKSLFFAAQAVGRYWIETDRFAPERGRGKGKIIGIASLTSMIGLSDMAPYAASKSGLLGVTRVLAVEWAQKGEDASRNAWIVSRIPMGRWGTPADLVGAALFLAAPASDYVTGQTLFVDGGWTSA